MFSLKFRLLRVLVLFLQGRITDRRYEGTTSALKVAEVLWLNLLWGCTGM